MHTHTLTNDLTPPPPLLQCCELLQLLGVPHLISRGEAEALCGLLSSHGVRCNLTCSLLVARGLHSMSFIGIIISSHYFYTLYTAVHCTYWYLYIAARGSNL